VPLLIVALSFSAALSVAIRLVRRFSHKSQKEPKTL
jgi:hypothetical protein